DLQILNVVLPSEVKELSDFKFGIDIKNNGDLDALANDLIVVVKRLDGTLLTPLLMSSADRGKTLGAGQSLSLNSVLLSTNAGQYTYEIKFKDKVIKTGNFEIKQLKAEFSYSISLKQMPQVNQEIKGGETIEIKPGIYVVEVKAKNTGEKEESPKELVLVSIDGVDVWSKSSVTKAVVKKGQEGSTAPGPRTAPKSGQQQKVVVTVYKADGTTELLKKEFNVKAKTITLVNTQTSAPPATTYAYNPTKLIAGKIIASDDLDLDRIQIVTEWVSVPSSPTFELSLNGEKFVLGHKKSTVGGTLAFDLNPMNNKAVLKKGENNYELTFTSENGMTIKEISAFTTSGESVKLLEKRSLITLNLPFVIDKIKVVNKNSKTEYVEGEKIKPTDQIIITAVITNKASVAATLPKINFMGVVPAVQIAQPGQIDAGKTKEIELYTGTLVQEGDRKLLIGIDGGMNLERKITVLLERPKFTVTQAQIFPARKDGTGYGLIVLNPKTAGTITELDKNRYKEVKLNYNVQSQGAVPDPTGQKITVSRVRGGDVQLLVTSDSFPSPSKGNLLVINTDQKNLDISYLPATGVYDIVVKTESGIEIFKHQIKIIDTTPTQVQLPIAQSSPTTKSIQTPAPTLPPSGGDTFGKEIKTSSPTPVQVVSTVTASIQIPVKTFVKVISPNGGEQLISEQNHVIKWESSPDIESVMLSYIPMATGQSMQILNNNIPNTGSYTWKVLNIDTTLKPLDENLAKRNEFKIKVIGNTKL
ncbi:MAG: hypothetical protein AABX39_01615, partial [Nanoarchaeota archaeon]